LSYRLVYTQKAVRDIDGLDAGIKNRIGMTLLRFRDNPLQYAERLTDSELGGYRFASATIA
jgi:mRNA interferase RelE/StbE